MTVAQELRRQGEVKGRKEGLEVGVQRGREEATHGVARRMLEKGIPVDLIIETTGLTAEQVAALRDGKTE